MKLSLSFMIGNACRFPSETKELRLSFIGGSIEYPRTGFCILHLVSHFPQSESDLLALFGCSALPFRVRIASLAARVNNDPELTP